MLRRCASPGGGAAGTAEPSSPTATAAAKQLARALLRESVDRDEAVARHSEIRKLESRVRLATRLAKRARARREEQALNDPGLLVREAADEAKTAGVDMMTRVMYGGKVPTVEVLGHINHLLWLRDWATTLQLTVAQLKDAPRGPSGVPARAPYPASNDGTGGGRVADHAALSVSDATHAGTPALPGSEHTGAAASLPSPASLPAVALPTQGSPAAAGYCEESGGCRSGSVVGSVAEREQKRTQDEGNGVGQWENRDVADCGVDFGTIHVALPRAARARRGQQLGKSVVAAASAVMQEYGVVALGSEPAAPLLPDSARLALRAQVLQLLEAVEPGAGGQPGARRSGAAGARGSAAPSFVRGAHLRDVPSPGQRWDLQLPQLAADARAVLAAAAGAPPAAPAPGGRTSTGGLGRGGGGGGAAEGAAAVCHALTPLLAALLGSVQTVQRAGVLVSGSGCGCQLLHRTVTPDCAARQFRVFVALQDVALRLGPLYVLPRTHARDFEDERPLELRAESTVLLPLKAGCIAVLDASVVRSATSNLSNEAADSDDEVGGGGGGSGDAVHSVAVVAGGAGRGGGRGGGAGGGDNRGRAAAAHDDNNVLLYFDIEGAACAALAALADEAGEAPAGWATGAELTTSEWRRQYYLQPAEWLARRDCFLYARLQPGEWTASTTSPDYPGEGAADVVELLVRIGSPRLRGEQNSGCGGSANGDDGGGGDNAGRYAFIVAQLSDGRLRFLRVPPAHAERAEQIIGGALASVGARPGSDGGTDGAGGPGRDGGVVEVYVAPSLGAAAELPDGWWSRQFVHVQPAALAGATAAGAAAASGAADSATSSAAYQMYRGPIDHILEDAVVAALRSARPDRIGISDGDGVQAPAPGAGLRVAELCSGDGSFAVRLLRRVAADAAASGAGPRVASYVMVERNADLAAAAAANASAAVTAATPAAVANPVAGRHGARVQTVVVDVSTPAGLAAVRAVEPPADVWVASGSVLCGQVGRPRAARPTLEALVASLAPGGRLVVTGFTQSFLEPGLLRQCGLEVERASVPEGAAGGLASGFRRFHLFVLRKQAPRAPGGARAVQAAAVAPPTTAQMAFRGEGWDAAAAAAAEQRRQQEEGVAVQQVEERGGAARGVGGGIRTSLRSWMFAEA